MSTTYFRTTRAFDTYITLCGKTVTTKDTRPGLPFGEKSCETCLRLEAVSMAEIERAIASERDEQAFAAEHEIGGEG